MLHKGLSLDKIKKTNFLTILHITTLVEEVPRYMKTEDS